MSCKRNLRVCALIPLLVLTLTVCLAQGALAEEKPADSLTAVAGALGIPAEELQRRLDRN